MERKIHSTLRREKKQKDNDKMKLNEKKLHAFLLVHKMKMMITLVLHIHFASKYRYIYSK